VLIFNNVGCVCVCVRVGVFDTRSLRNSNRKCEDSRNHKWFEG